MAGPEHINVDWIGNPIVYEVNQSPRERLIGRYPAAFFYSDDTSNSAVSLFVIITSQSICTVSIF